MRRLGRYTGLATGVAIVFAAGSIALAACTASAPTAAPVSATQRPTPTPVPGPTLAAGVVVNLVAATFVFSNTTLDVPANAPFVIHFRNLDAADMSHVVDIAQQDGITVLRDQVPIAGGEDADYLYDGLPRGDYLFRCSIHPIPSMTGKLRVR